jgi:hypothetical protein
MQHKLDRAPLSWLGPCCRLRLFHEASASVDHTLANLMRCSVLLCMDIVFAIQSVSKVASTELSDRSYGGTWVANETRWTNSWTCGE